MRAALQKIWGDGSEGFETRRNTAGATRILTNVEEASENAILDEANVSDLNFTLERVGFGKPQRISVAKCSELGSVDFGRSHAGSSSEKTVSKLLAITPSRVAMIARV